MAKVVFAWSGLPDYAARCIRAVIDMDRHDVDVIATRPDVPIQGMEASLNQPVHWVDHANRNLCFGTLGMDRPDIFFCGGYHIPAFRSLTAECNQYGVPVVLLCDNYLHGTLARRLLSALRHRLWLRRRYVGLLVPGEAGRRYAEAMGYEHSCICTGMYSADPALFHDGAPLSRRPKRLLFVGRFDQRKNVVSLVRAFESFARRHEDWELHLCGSGPLSDQIRPHPKVTVNGFVQPCELSKMMREARCLILPSHNEHFGLVVHEAALSGCALALSNAVGAAADLASVENAVLFSPRSTAAITNALECLADWDDARWDAAGAESVKLAARISPKKFARAVDVFLGQTKTACPLGTDTA